MRWRFHPLTPFVLCTAERSTRPNPFSLFLHRCWASGPSFLWWVRHDLLALLFINILWFFFYNYILVTSQWEYSLTYRELLCPFFSSFHSRIFDMSPNSDISEGHVACALCNLYIGVTIHYCMVDFPWIIIAREDWILRLVFFLGPTKPLPLYG